MYIDNKIESVWRIALEEADDGEATRQVFEFLDMIIEEVDEMHFLMLRLPLQCGEHLWLAYRECVEEELAVVLGLERVYWALRRGLGNNLPRRKDFSVAHRFKTLPSTALEDAQRRWQSFCDTLKESCEELKAVARAVATRVTLDTSAAARPSPRPRPARTSTAAAAAVISETLEISFAVGSMDLEGVAQEAALVAAVPFVAGGAQEAASASAADAAAGTRWFNLRQPIEPAAAEAVTAEADTNCFDGIEISPGELDFLKAATNLIECIHIVFKMVRTRHLSSPNCPIKPSNRRHAPRRLQLDDLQEAAAPVPETIERVTRALQRPPPYNHAIICKDLTEAVAQTEAVIEEVMTSIENPERTVGLERSVEQLEFFLQPLNEMNSFR